MWFIFICYHIYNVWVLHEFVTTLRLRICPLPCILFCFMFHISGLIIHYPCHITEAEGEVGIP